MSEPVVASSSQGPPSETTPLLGDVASVPVNIEEQETQQSSPASPSAADGTLPVVIATWVILGSGVLTVAFGTAFSIIRSVAPLGFAVSYMLRDVLPILIILPGVAVLFAIFNLIQLRRVGRTLSVPLDIVLDLVIAVPILACLAQVWDFVGVYCSEPYGRKWPEEVLRRCEAWTRMTIPVLWTFLILAGLVGFTSVFLAIGRAILLYQRRGTRNTTSWTNWRLPGGQLTVEFTVKFLRQDATQNTTVSSERQEPAAV